MYVADGYVASGYVGGSESLTRFVSGSRSIVFERSPLRPQRRTQRIQALASPGAARPVSAVAVATDEYFDLTFLSVSAFHLTAFLAFWRDVAKGAAQEFLWRDTFGTERTARFVSGELPKIVTIAGVSRLEVTLRVTT